MIIPFALRILTSATTAIYCSHVTHLVRWRQMVASRRIVIFLDEHFTIIFHNHFNELQVVDSSPVTLELARFGRTILAMHHKDTIAVMRDPRLNHIKADLQKSLQSTSMPKPSMLSIHLGSFDRAHHKLVNNSSTNIQINRIVVVDIRSQEITVETVNHKINMIARGF